MVEHILINVRQTYKTLDATATTKSSFTKTKVNNRYRTYTLHTITDTEPIFKKLGLLMPLLPYRLNHIAINQQNLASYELPIQNGELSICKYMYAHANNMFSNMQTKMAY